MAAPSLSRGGCRRHLTLGARRARPQPCRAPALGPHWFQERSVSCAERGDTFGGGAAVDVRSYNASYARLQPRPPTSRVQRTRSVSAWTRPAPLPVQSQCLPTALCARPATSRSRSSGGCGLRLSPSLPIPIQRRPTAVALSLSPLSSARSKTVVGGAVRRAGAGDGGNGSPIVVTDAKQEVTVSQFVAQLDEAARRRLNSMHQISVLVKSIRTLARMEDPINQILKRTEVAENLILEKTSCPLGVLLVIFESRPDALVQIASLAIRSGNGLLLKGGKEAMRSNKVLHKVITGAIPSNVGEKLIGLVTSRDEIADLLKVSVIYYENDDCTIMP
eukprot:XP_020404631.1 uncharacterized protein LOC103649060 [Zea mays]